MTQARRIVVNTAAAYGQSLYSIVCRLFTSRWVLQALGAVDYGLMGLVGGLTLFVGVFSQMLSNATSRFYGVAAGASGGSSEGVEERKRWFNCALFVHAVVPLMTLIVVWPLGEWAIRHWLAVPVGRVGQTVWVFRFACLGALAEMVSVPFCALFVARQRLVELTVFNCCTTTLYFGFAAFMATHPGDWLVRFGLAVLVVGGLSQSLVCVRAFLVLPECRIVPSYLWDRRRLARFASFVASQSLAEIDSLVKSNGIPLLINKMFGPVYNATLSLSTVASERMASLSVALNAAFAPVLFNLAGARRSESVLEMAYLQCRLGALLTLLFAIPAVLEMEALLSLWLTSPPPLLAEATRLTLTMAVMDGLCGGAWRAVFAKGRLAGICVALGVASLLTLPTMAGIVRFGEGGYLAVIAVQVLFFAVRQVLQLAMARRLTGFSVRHWFASAFAPTLVATVPAAAVGWAVRLALAPGFARLLVTTALVVPLFLALSYRFALTERERRFVLSGCDFLK